jgi:hypothetical protein
MATECRLDVAMLQYTLSVGLIAAAGGIVLVRTC